AALASLHAHRIVPGANGMFLSTLVLDGQVRGTWRRTVRAKAVMLDAIPFTRMKSADKKAFAIPVERYAEYLGTPVTMAWADR
ncbi:MAG: crosslink repair DNA glycosylase YcaQ family protein, partial [bacterium]